MTITVYSHLDSGAPVLDGQAGSLITLLSACLVSGYGSKTAAGWSRPYLDANVGVFAPGVGAAFYLQIDDSASRVSTYAGRVAAVRIFESMSDANTGLDPMPLTGSRYVPKSTSADATARPWLVIADEQGFYLLINSYGTTLNESLAHQELMWFGRIVPTNSSDAWAVALAAPRTDSWSVNNDWLSLVDGSGAISTTGALVMRSFDGQSKSVGLAHMHGLDSTAFIGWTGLAEMESSDDWLLYPGPVLNSEAGYKRGFWPGLWYSMGTTASHATYGSAGLTLDGPSGAGSLLCVRCALYSTESLVFIDITDWGRA